jgi:membrane protease YdiL (CAAX protease family)
MNSENPFQTPEQDSREATSKEVDVLGTGIWLFWNTAERRLRAGYRLLIQIVVTFVLIIAMVVALSPLLGNEKPPTYVMMMLGTLQQVVVMTTVILACLFLDRRWIRSLGMKFNGRWWTDFFAGFFIAAAMMGLIFAIELQLGWITLSDEAPDWGKVIPLQLGWLGMFTCVGIVEEVFSRGYQLKNLCEGFKRLGKLPSFLLASIISSAVFGLLHAMNPGATLISTASIGLAGIMFCVVRLCTGSLAAPIGLHISWNYFQGPIFGFGVSGNQTEGSIFTVDSAENPTWSGGEFGPEAGLMGLFAVLAMIGLFLLWPADKSPDRLSLMESGGLNDSTRLNENLTQLAEFQPKHAVGNDVEVLVS